MTNYIRKSLYKIWNFWMPFIRGSSEPLKNTFRTLFDTNPQRFLAPQAKILLTFGFLTDFIRLSLWNLKPLKKFPYFFLREQISLNFRKSILRENSLNFKDLPRGSLTQLKKKDFFFRSDMMDSKSKWDQQTYFFIESGWCRYSIHPRTLFNSSYSCF